MQRRLKESRNSGSGFSWPAPAPGSRVVVDGVKGMGGRRQRTGRDGMDDPGPARDAIDASP